MKKHLKKILCLTFIFIFAFSFTVFADDDGDDGPCDYEDDSTTTVVDFSEPSDTSFDDTTWTIEYEDGTEEEYVPNSKARWVAINTVAMSLDFKFAGKACFSTTVGAKSNTYKIKIVTKLQSYRNGAWKTLYTKTKTSSSSSICQNDGYYYVTKGYKYRTRNTITISNSSGTVLETDTLNCTRTYN
jgi:hypothetical protein